MQRKTIPRPSRQGRGMAERGHDSFYSIHRNPKRTDQTTARKYPLAKGPLVDPPGRRPGGKRKGRRPGKNGTFRPSSDLARQGSNLKPPDPESGPTPTPTPCNTTTNADQNGACCTAGCTKCHEILSDDARLASVIQAWTARSDEGGDRGDGQGGERMMCVRAGNSGNGNTTPADGS